MDLTCPHRSRMSVQHADDRLQDPTVPPMSRSNRLRCLAIAAPKSAASRSIAVARAVGSGV
jgi:hypothetical protein